jgi:hypothetical protein
MDEMSRRYDGPLLLFLLIIGGVVGAWIGEWLVSFRPALGTWISSDLLGFSPFTLNLKVLTITFGLAVKLNVFTILGMIGAFFIYRKI